jgi:hypothetical protein
MFWVEREREGLGKGEGKKEKVLLSYEKMKIEEVEGKSSSDGNAGGEDRGVEDSGFVDFEGSWRDIEGASKESQGK